MKDNITNAREDYLNQFGILHSSAVGVILTRTREPYRAELALAEWAHVNEVGAFKRWDCLYGWLERTPDERKNPPPDGKKEVVNALSLIQDINGQGQNPFDDGVYVAQYPHWTMAKHPVLIQLLKEYSRTLPETDKQLVLIVPEGFILPPELQNDITVLDFDLPRQTELRDVYDKTLDATGDDATEFDFSEADISTLLKTGSGMTEGEFETALSRAFIESFASEEFTIEAVNKILMDAKTEVVKRSEVLEVMPTGRMEDIGGLDVLKDWVGKRECCFTDEAIEFGVDIPKGIVAIGPPGTGKSICAKAIAGRLKQPLIRFDVGKVFGSLVGQSEERVRAALKQLEAMSPCVAFIDEVDKAGIDPRQGGGDSGTSKRVMGNILTHMQESTAPVFWVLTANRVDGLPPEMLRKGRVDEVFAVLPPNDPERMEIIKIHLRKRKHDPDEVEGLQEAVEFSLGFVGAEIEAAIKEAVIDSYTSGEPLTGTMIADQLRGMKPISEAFKEDFDAMTQWAERNARLASSKDAVIEESPRSRRRIKTSRGKKNGK